jgi:nitric oxide reductase subunit B
MQPDPPDLKPLSPWWRRAVLLVMLFGFSVLSLVTVKTHQGAPPIPSHVVDTSGNVVKTGEEIESGQEVFFKYGLMEHGTLWGHGAYLGPDDSAEYLHRTVEIGRDLRARARFSKAFSELGAEESAEIEKSLKTELRQNRFDAATDTLIYSGVEAASYRTQAAEWQSYFSGSQPAPGLPAGFIGNFSAGAAPRISTHTRAELVIGISRRARSV